MGGPVPPRPPKCALKDAFQGGEAWVFRVWPGFFVGWGEFFCGGTSPPTPHTSLPSLRGTGAELSGVQWTARNDSPVSKGDERAKETRVSTRSSSPIAI